jgi:hypothetical protein
MYRFGTALSAGIIATVLVSSSAFVPTPAAAATADRVALKEATVACKAEAKDKNIRWPASRKYVKNCLARTLKRTPTDIEKIAEKEAIVACKAEAKGKKIRWPASRKFVSSCVTAALKDYSLDINQLRRDMNLNGLRVYTPEEIGCQQNVFC